MFQQPELTTPLWLIPLAILILVPLSFTILGILLRFTKAFFFTVDRMGTEKRSHPRFIPYDGTIAEITVGETTCTGLVCDISRVGISLSHLPHQFLDKMDKLTVVIRGYGEDHNLLVRPKWVADTASGKQLGAEIDFAPPGWNQFILQTERISPFESR